MLSALYYLLLVLLCTLFMILSALALVVCYPLIRFRFPVYFKGKEVQEISWDEDTTVETVCLLERGAV